jgi:hypothetical protein
MFEERAPGHAKSADSEKESSVLKKRSKRLLSVSGGTEIPWWTPELGAIDEGFLLLFFKKEESFFFVTARRHQHF